MPIVPPRLHPLMPLSNNHFTASSLGSLCHHMVVHGGHLGHLVRVGTPRMVLHGRGHVLRRSISSLFSGSHGSDTIGASTGHPLGSLSSDLGNGRKHFHRGLLNGHISCSTHSIVIMNPRLGVNRYNVPGLVTTRLCGPFVVHGLVRHNVIGAIGSTGGVMSHGRPIV